MRPDSGDAHTNVLRAAGYWKQRFDRLCYELSVLAPIQAQEIIDRTDDTMVFVNYGGFDEL